MGFIAGFHAVKASYLTMGVSDLAQTESTLAISRFGGILRRSAFLFSRSKLISSKIS